VALATPTRGTGRGVRVAASHRSPYSAVVVGRTASVDTVPTGYGRPRGDAMAYPVDDNIYNLPAGRALPGQLGRRSAVDADSESFLAFYVVIGKVTVR